MAKSQLQHGSCKSAALPKAMDLMPDLCKGFQPCLSKSMLTHLLSKSISYHRSNQLHTKLEQSNAATHGGVESDDTSKTMRGSITSLLMETLKKQYLCCACVEEGWNPIFFGGGTIPLE